MYILYDAEIEKLGKQAEEFVKHQRSMMSTLKNSKYKNLIIPENAKDIAKYLLNDIHHLQGDLERLEKVIEKNLSDMEWFNSLL